VAICTSAVPILVCPTARAAGPNVAFLEGAVPAGVAVDSQGNIFMAGQTVSSTLPATTGAAQTTYGGNTDAFIAKFSPDGTLLWCTYFGGSAYDYANALAVDSAGNVVVTGLTQSANLPVLNAFQRALQGNSNAFVVKLNPAGQILYSTYLGGSGGIQGNAIAADAAGNAYLAGRTTSEDFPGQPPGTVGDTFVAKLDAAGALVYSFIYSRNILGPRGIAVDSSGSAYVVGQPEGPSYPSLNLNLAFVFKLSPDGTHLLYESFFGGSQNNDEAAIAVDSTGAVYIAGTTDSVDFPQVHSLQPSIGARPLWVSIDGGNTWSPFDNLPFAYLQTLVPDPTTPGTLYAGASDLGVFKSVDGAGDWTRISNGIATPAIYSLAVNPANPALLYAGGGIYPPSPTPWGAWIFQTTDGGANWSLGDSPGYTVDYMAVDPLTPSTVYALASVEGLKTTDSGAAWNTLPSQPPDGFASFAMDPKTEGTLYGYSVLEVMPPIFGVGYAPKPADSIPFGQVFRSTDGGATWHEVQGVTPGAPGLVIDPSTTPATVYAGTSARSSDGGNTWTPLTAPFPKAIATAMAADPTSGKLYAAAPAASSLLVSTDRGQSWNPTGWPYANSTITAITPSAGALYATVQNTQTSAFVVKLNPAGSVVYSTLLNGHPSLATVPSGECGPSLPLQCYEPQTLAYQNYATSLALDPAGDIAVAGGTRALDFPTANPLQPANAGGADAFLAVISADGSQLQYSTYLGGSVNDGAFGVTADAQGNLIVAGLTSSTDFLGQSVTQGGNGSGFVVKLAPPAAAVPTITAVVNAASFSQAIEAGSWVAIQGANLADTTGVWQNSDFIGNNLPTVVDGVSVTIGGKAAFVEYVSPTQINVQAPSDGTVGTVNVVVTNNGVASAPAIAQLQAVAPAFFMGPENNALASLLPGYTPVTATAPAMPGDLVVLWGTGFGPTNPPAPAGTIISGAPVTSTLPVVTVGGIQVSVVSSVLTTGTVGLYQITIQLPANVPTGTPAVQASIAGVPTQAGVTLFVGAQ
jgi:uncharacterized protein (TIGR03437 family)